MNPPTPLHRAARSIYWQTKVREAAAQLTHDIQRLERYAPDTLDTSEWLATLSDLRRRLARIDQRYGSILD